MQLIPRQERNPFRELEDLSTRVYRILGRPLFGRSEEGEALALADWLPSCEVSETESEYRLSAQLPRVKKEDVDVTVEDGVLTLSGERHVESETQGRKFHRRELEYGHFVRRFTIPDDADPEKIDATFEDGMLNVTIAKTSEKRSRAVKISVH
jgi:HSP20 family protein